MIEVVWGRIKDCEGQIFRQLRGGEFTYKVKGNFIELSRMNISVRQDRLVNE